MKIPQNPPGTRAFCYACFKPELACICKKIRRVHNRTGILILQHSRERKHPVGTARIAKLALEKVSLEIGHYEPPLKPATTVDLPERTALLYPSKSAIELSEIPESERPEHLVVLDGTWRTVRTLYRKHKWLKDLQHVRLTPEAPSRYRIRKAPREDNLSTIEAIAQALKILEPDNLEIDDLLTMFQEMIDDQVRHMPARETPRFH